MHRVVVHDLILVFFVAFASGMILFPLFIQWQKNRHLGQKIKKEGPNIHLHKENTPSMGGMIVFCAILIAFIIGGEFSRHIVFPILLLTAYTILGFVDDWYKSYLDKPWGIKARYKFIYQVVIASFILLPSLNWIPNQISIPFTNTFVHLPLPLFFGYGVLIIVATSNAFNITDGLDGLAAGSGILSFLFWGFMLILIGESSISQIAFGAIGGLMALLWFNVWPARIFMGDSGSLGLGAFMGFMALISGQSLLLFFSALVFVIDTLSVILQVFSFKLLGKRLFLMSPLHHHYELKGIKETQITVRFWIIQVIGVTMAWLGRAG